MVTYNDNTLGLNTVATHTCNPGYTLTTGTNTRTCGTNTGGDEDGWSGADLICGGMIKFDYYSLKTTTTLLVTLLSKGCIRISPGFFCLVFL